MLIEITGVGAFVKPEGHDRARPKLKGDRVNVSDEDARRLIANGAAVRVTPDAPAPDAAAAAEMPDLQTMTVPELRSFASERQIRLGGTRTRPEILGAIQAALADDLAARGVPGEGSVLGDASAVDPGFVATEGAAAVPSATSPGNIGQRAAIDPETIPRSDEDPEAAAGQQDAESV
jgi:hypothetical protein